MSKRAFTLLHLAAGFACTVACSGRSHVDDPGGHASGGSSGAGGSAGIPPVSECTDVPNGIPTRGTHAPFEVAATQGETFGLAVDATHAYWVSPGDGDPDSTFRILRVSLGGGVPEVLASMDGNPFMPLALDEGRVYWATPGRADTRQPGTVGSVSKQGGDVEILYSEVTYISSSWLVVDQQFVYWTDFERIQRIGKRPGGAAVEIVATAGQGIAQDEDTLYWADYSDGAIGGVSKLGGAPVVLVMAAAMRRANQKDLAQLKAILEGRTKDG